MDYKFLKLENNENILTLTINREKSLNALNSEVINELDKCFTEIELSTDIEVVVITGAGKAFVAGADISEMSTLNPAEASEFAKRGMDVFLKLEKLKIPVIAAINGFALGGGCELALSCDIRVASTKALIGQPEVGLGITPGFGGTQRLARTVGLAKAKELIFTAEPIKAEKAYEIGLVSHVVEPENLMEQAYEIARKITKNSKTAIRNCKESMNTGMQVDIDTAMNIEKSLFGLCFATNDQKEGMNAFLEKRKPQFQNN